MKTGAREPREMAALVQCIPWLRMGPGIALLEPGVEKSQGQR